MTKGFQKGNKINVGKKYSLERRKKIGLANKGKNIRNHLTRYLIDKNGCWIWQGCFRSKNCRYGVIHFKKGKGGIILAHRYFYEKLIDKIPKGKILCHKCDITKCVNPNHMFIGSHIDNMKDKVRKGRQPTGEKHPSSKLDLKKVIEIRNNYIPYKNSYKKLAEKYNCHYDTVQKIVNKKLWK